MEKNSVPTKFSGLKINLQTRKSYNPIKNSQIIVKNNLFINNEESDEIELEDRKERDINIYTYETAEHDSAMDDNFLSSPKSTKSLISTSEKKRLNEFGLKRMIDLIDLCCTNPMRQVEFIVELFKGVDFLLSHEKYWREFFDFTSNNINSKNQQLELNNQIDYFLQNALILIENQEQIRLSLISILANMSVINIPEEDMTTNDEIREITELNSFGFKCLKAIKELIKNGNPDLKQLVSETLKKVVIPMLNRDDLKQVPFNILLGCSLIVNEYQYEDLSLFDDNIMNYAALWISQIAAQSRSSEFGNYIQRTQDFKQHDVVLGLISALTYKKSIAFNLAGRLNLKHLQSILYIYYEAERAKKEKQKSTIINLVSTRFRLALQILINISNHIEDQAKSRQILIDIIKKDLEIRLIENELREIKLWNEKCLSKKWDEDTYTQNKIEEIYYITLYYQNLSLMITAYAKVLKFKDLNVMDFKESPYAGGCVTCVNKLITLICNSKINPLILKACSIFILNVLKHPNLEIKSDAKLFGEILIAIKDFLPLLGYLGGVNYDNLCMMDIIYEPDNFEGDELIYQKSIRIHEAIYHIIRVIKFLCVGASKGKSGNKVSTFCWEVVNKNNFQIEAKIALLRVFDLPNDNIKILVLKTLYFLEFSNWGEQDIKILIDYIKLNRNLQKKNCEEIFSEIFLLFSKLISGNLDGNESSRKFEETFGQESVEYCFEILLNNMERNYKENSKLNEKKMLLSVSCIFYLKRVSLIQNLQKIFFFPKIITMTKKFFFKEERYLSENESPLLLEDTWLCQNIESILQCTAGNEQIKAESLLGFRLISKLGDILQDKPLFNFESEKNLFQNDLDNEEENDEDDMDKLIGLKQKPSKLIYSIKHLFEQNLLKKINSELEVWSSKLGSTNFGLHLKKAAMNTKNLKNNEKEINEDEDQGIDTQQIVYRLTMFVLMNEQNLQSEDTNSKKLLEKKIEDYILSLRLEKDAKPKMNMYDIVKVKDKSEFDPKNLRGKERLEMVLQTLNTMSEIDIQTKFHHNFFDINNYIFFDIATNEDYLRNQNDSPLRRHNNRSPGIDNSSFVFYQEEDNNTALLRKLKKIKKNDNEKVVNSKMIFEVLAKLKSEKYEFVIQEILDHDNENYNINISTIVLSSLFRVIYFAMKKSKLTPKETIKNQINSLNIIRGLTKLTRRIGWINTNIGYKYLRGLKFFYILPKQEVNQDKSIIYIYDIIFKGINQMLYDIKNQFLDANERDLLKMELTYLIREISNSSKILANQIKYIIWDERYETTKIEKKELHSKFIKKTIQEKCIEFLLTHLLPIKSVETIIRILVGYVKLYEKYEEIKEFDLAAINLKKKIVYNFQVLLGNYLFLCEEHKYDIMRLLSENENLRKSFINEILDEMDKQYLIKSLENYFSKYCYFFSNKRERVLNGFWCNMTEFGETKEDQCFFFLTNRGIYATIIPTSYCNICPHYEFCKEGPKILYKEQYIDILNLIELESSHQRFVLMAKRKNKNKDHLFIFQFLKKNAMKHIMKIILKQSNIRLETATLINQSIEQIEVSFHFLTWSLVSYEKKTFSDLNEKTMEIRLIIFNTKNSLIILKEKQKDWDFKDRKFIGFSDDNNKITKQNNAHKIFEKEREYDLVNDMTVIAYDKSDKPAIYMQFGKDKYLTILFYCDNAREEFKSELNSEIKYKNWRKSEIPPQKLRKSSKNLENKIRFSNQKKKNM